MRRQRRKKRDARGSCHGAGASEAAWVGLTLLEVLGVLEIRS